MMTRLFLKIRGEIMLDITKNMQVIPPKRYFRVVIYARVSSNKNSQLRSEAAQISHFARLISAHSTWLLTDVYMDFESAKAGAKRPEYERMLSDAKAKKFDKVLVKSVSRIARDSVVFNDFINLMQQQSITVYFEESDRDTSEGTELLQLQVTAAMAQAENEMRSMNIKTGLRFRGENGTSGLYKRPCYGYAKSKKGDLVIDKEKAANVKLIFESYMKGLSLDGIVEELSFEGVKSPKGKDKWSKSMIDAMLSNDKYIGDVTIVQSGGNGSRYRYTETHEPIISKELFQAVQMDKRRRSNLEEADGVVKRKKTKYSSKKK